MSIKICEYKQKHKNNNKVPLIASAGLFMDLKFCAVELRSETQTARHGQCKTNFKIKFKLINIILGGNKNVLRLSRQFNFTFQYFCYSFWKNASISFCMLLICGCASFCCHGDRLNFFLRRFLQL